MSTEALTAWAVSLMLATSPPGRSKIPDAVETAEEGRVRYAEIATAIVDAAEGNKRAVALLLAIAKFESGFRRDVDLGIGPLAKGDDGRACGLWQIHAGKRCDELIADRRLAASEALRLARASFAACRSRPMLERLGAFTAGSCARGAAASRARLQTAERFLAWHPAPSP